MNYIKMKQRLFHDTNYLDSDCSNKKLLATGKKIVIKCNKQLTNGNSLRNNVKRDPVWLSLY